MTQKTLFIPLACILIIGLLYWLKHGKESSDLLNIPTPVTPISSPTTPQSVLEPPKPAEQVKPVPKPIPKRKIIINNDYDLTPTPGWTPPEITPKFVLDETGSEVPYRPPEEKLELSPTDVPGYSVTSTKDTWQIFRAVIIRSSSPREDWEKARDLVQSHGLSITFETEKLMFQLRTTVPADSWKDFTDALASEGWDYKIEPSSKVENLPPDQSVGVSITIQEAKQS
ncbi:MAG: hypothetical protein HYS08_01905 [Chlamydiae bacterium]|nr:hypothetical protein [Chlamydiota bacterium]MBI3266837.1 hypothetical protein [Chlamydiota bacterium]